MFVTSAPICDLAVVFATKDPKLGMWGITAFIVDRGTPGFSVGKDIEKMGLRTSPMGELILEDVFIPAENLLGSEGGGAKIFARSMEWERSCILGSHLGAMDYQMEKVVSYARERQQFKQAIGKFQSVSNRVADMKVRLDGSRYLLYRVAWLKSRDKNATMEAAMAKLSVSETYVRNSEDAIRILGGYGYATEYEVERDLRDAIGGTLYSGTSDIQRNIIARLMRL
jgi:alkylation response protein AidB-like acyl-CoA dehydrogenase